MNWPGMEQLARRQSEMNATGNNDNVANDEEAVDAENAGAIRNRKKAATPKKSRRADALQLQFGELI